MMRVALGSWLGALGLAGEAAADLPDFETVACGLAIAALRDEGVSTAAPSASAAMAETQNSVVATSKSRSVEFFRGSTSTVTMPDEPAPWLLAAPGRALPAAIIADFRPRLRGGR